MKDDLPEEFRPTHWSKGLFKPSVPGRRERNFTVRNFFALGPGPGRDVAPWRIADLGSLDNAVPLGFQGSTSGARQASPPLPGAIAGPEINLWPAPGTRKTSDRRADSAPWKRTFKHQNGQAAIEQFPVGPTEKRGP